MKILFLTSRFPFPLEKGDKLRAYHQIKGLAARHEVHLAALSDEHVSTSHYAALNTYCRSIHVSRISGSPFQFQKLTRWLKGLPAQVAYFYSESAAKNLNKYFGEVQPDVVICQLLRMAPYTYHWDCPKVLDYMDAFSTGALRQAKNKGLLGNLFWRTESYRMGRMESQVFRTFDQHWVISDRDRDELVLDDTKSKAVRIVPNGIDTEYFSPSGREKKFDMAFVGNMGYRPNIQAANFLIDEILPELKLQNIEPKVLIAGARPPAALLARQSEHVKVSGWMNDIRDAYRSSRIFVAPLFTGSGLQNKLLEAMACGLPCLTTPLVNEALSAPQNVITLEENAKNFARSIKKLLDHPAKAEGQGMLARDFVKTNYQWSIFIDQMNVNLHELSKNKYGKSEA